MTDTDLFYANLPILSDFLEITNPQNFYPVPRDWYIVITDVVGSTQATEAGRYKDVNLLGACSIIVVLNSAGNLEIPFMFGGDGATLLIPPSLFARTKDALLVVRQRARTEFNLDLRVGSVPVSEVVKANYDVRVAKLEISENYHQAIFTGQGVSYATQLIKNPATTQLYSFGNLTSKANADFTGLECRWQDIPSRYGEIVSLIVKATSESDEINNQIYRHLIQAIFTIYGREEYLNPVDKNYLKLAFSYKGLKAETQIKSQPGRLGKLRYFSRIWLENLLGLMFMQFKLKLPDVDWGIYRDLLIATTDYKKFDGMLQMVIAGKESQRKRLISYLEGNYRKGRLVYGLHVSDRALMTCLVFERNGRQVHFVDGADGGYALAAKELKQRLKNQQGSQSASQ